MLARALALLAALAALPSCIFVDTGPGTNRPVVPTADTYRIAIGAGVDQIPLDYVGYVITASSGSYRLVWLGAGVNFSGSVWIESGTPQFVEGCEDGTCALDGREDRVFLGSEAGRVDFVSTPQFKDASGFDLKFVGDTIYDLTVNGVRDRQRVLFVDGSTGQIATPRTIPFALTM